MPPFTEQEKAADLSHGPWISTGQRLGDTLSPSVTSMKLVSGLHRAQPRTNKKPGVPFHPTHQRGDKKARDLAYRESLGFLSFPKALLSQREVGHSLRGCQKKGNIRMNWSNTCTGLSACQWSTHQSRAAVSELLAPTCSQFLLLVARSD